MSRQHRVAAIQDAHGSQMVRGFGSVLVDELAGPAGVARRTLYNQFASKEDRTRDRVHAISIFISANWDEKEID